MADAIYYTGSAIFEPLRAIWFGILNVLPGIVGAIIVLIFGYFVGMVLGMVLSGIIKKLGIDEKLKKINFTEPIGHFHMSEILGGVIKWYIFILFLQQAATLVSLGTLSNLLVGFSNWLPNLLAAMLIAIVGVLIGDYLEEVIHNAKNITIKWVGSITKYVTFVFTALIALDQVGINISLANQSWLILWGSLCIAIAIALGISLGHALKDESKDWVKSWKRKF